MVPREEKKTSHAMNSDTVGQTLQRHAGPTDLPSPPSEVFSDDSSSFPFPLSSALQRVEHALTLSSSALQKEKSVHHMLQASLEALRTVCNSDFPEQLAIQMKNKKEQEGTAGYSLRAHGSRSGAMATTTSASPFPVVSWEAIRTTMGGTLPSTPHPSSMMVSCFDDFIHAWCLQQTCVPCEERETGQRSPTWFPEVSSVNNSVTLECERDANLGVSVVDGTRWWATPHGNHWETSWPRGDKEEEEKKTAARPMKRGSPSPPPPTSISLQPLWSSMKWMELRVRQHSQDVVLNRVDTCVEHLQDLTRRLQEIEDNYHLTFLMASCAAAMEVSTIQAIRQWKEDRTKKGEADGSTAPPCSFSPSSLHSSQLPKRESTREKTAEHEEVGNDGVEEEKMDNREGALSLPTEALSFLASLSSTRLQDTYRKHIRHLLHLPPSPPGSVNPSLASTVNSHKKNEEEKEKQEGTGNTEKEERREVLGEVEKETKEEEGEDVRMETRYSPEISFLQEMQKNGTFVVPSLDIFELRKRSRIVLDHLPPPPRRPSPRRPSPRLPPPRRGRARPSSFSK